MPSRRPKPSAEPKAAAHPLETTLGYTFHDPALLTLALTHKSLGYEERGGALNPLKNQPGTDNEQLEFLGDAVLGLIVTELLLEHFPQCDEGELTRLRAALVSRKRMAELGATLHLGAHLLVGRSAEHSGARDRPALIANAAEAVLAALYLDAMRSGADALTAARTLLRRLLLQPELPALEAALATSGPRRGALRDAKTLLQERAQAHNTGRLRYVDTDMAGPPHDRRFVVEVRLDLNGEQTTLASGEGLSKRDAQQQAAGRALTTWNPDAPEPKP
jgi:ribonuclease-3